MVHRAVQWSVVERSAGQWSAGQRRAAQGHGAQGTGSVDYTRVNGPMRPVFEGSASRPILNTVCCTLYTTYAQCLQITRGNTSLGDIHKLPTLCVLALFRIFYKFCFDVHTFFPMSSHRGGGVCVYFFKSVRKGHFRNVWIGGGGRWSHFSGQHDTLDGAHEHGTAPVDHLYCESASSSAVPFSGRAGTPLGQTSPCLWTGTYFFNFSQSCNLRTFTGTQPSLRGIAHRPSECGALCEFMQVAGTGQYEAFWPGCQADDNSPAPTPHPQSELVCAPMACAVHRGKQQHVA